MRPVHHAVSSAVFACATYAVTGSPLLAAVNGAAGVLIDVDHIPEFIALYARKSRSIGFLKDEMHLTAQRTFLVLHGFDAITLLFFIIYTAGFGHIAWALYIGCMQHLLLDTLYNPVRSPLSYFLLYRIIKKFETQALFHQIDVKTWARERKKKQ